MGRQAGIPSLAVFAVLGAGCDREVVVSLSGTVFASSAPTSGALAEATVRFVDFEEQQIGSARTDEQGAFRAELPGGVPLLVEISSEGYATSTFPGVIGLAPEQDVEHRALYGVSLAEVDEWRARFAGCPGADDLETAMVFGEIRLHGFTDPLTGGQPSTNVGQANVQVGREVLPGCYLDDAGLAYDPESIHTGATGVFAVFGVPTGLNELTVRADLPGAPGELVYYPVWVPRSEGAAVVSPWFPAEIALF